MRSNISRALYLLKETHLPCWENITISTHHLEAWAEEGSLLHHPNNDHTTNSEADTNNPTVMDSMSLGLNHDGDDTGPAILQNGEAPEELMEGIIPLNNDSSFGAVAAVDAGQQLLNAVETIRQNLHGAPSHSNGSNTDGRAVRFSEDGAQVFLQQDDVVEHHEYVNMCRDAFAWHLLFPTVF